jgi:serine/threonine-protein kinase
MQASFEHGQPSSLDGARSERVIGGTYRIVKPLARGGMADVYQAEHLRLQTAVAVKFLRATISQELGWVERFRQEARRVASLRSDRVVKVFDYGELPDGTPYLVMELLVGEDLRTLLVRDGALPVRRAVRLVVDACRGLEVVHDAGIVHRDLKPANLFVERTGAGVESCKLLDFGVSKLVTGDTTRPGAMLGTVRYMAPEQLDDAKAVDARSDVYSLGAILYECLTGVPVHPGETVQEVMFHVLHASVERPTKHVPIPVALETAILRALSRDRGSRFRSAADFAQALRPFGALEASAARTDSTVDQTSPELSVARELRPSRGRSSAAVRGLVLCGAFGLGAAGGWYARAPARSEPSFKNESPHRTPEVTAPSTETRAVMTAASRAPMSLPAALPPMPSSSEAIIEKPPRQKPLLPTRASVGKKAPESVPRLDKGSLTSRFDPIDPYE